MFTAINAQQREKIMRKIAFLILSIIVLSGCSENPQLIVPTTLPPTPDPCPVDQINQFIEFVKIAEDRLTQLTQKPIVHKAKN